MAAMEGHKRLDIDVRQAITVCNHERLIADQILQAPETTACQGSEPGIDDPNLPVGHGGISHVARAVFQIDEQIAVVHQEAMKVLLDHLAFVAAGNEEILEAMAGVDAHDMPEHRLARAQCHRCISRPLSTHCGC